MARVTHVKHARQRYEQKPANITADGKPVRVGLTRKDGSPKMTSGRRGGTPRQIFITPMVDDRTKPLPMPKCEKCSKVIEPGQPYKHVTPKSGPYGGRRRNRCATCPTWQYWELSNSWSARIAQVQHDAAEEILTAELSEEADAQSLAESVAQQARDLAEQKQEAADNLEEGFGHPTSQSEEIAGEADELNNWADEIENVDLPDFPEAEDTDCDECNGTGEITTGDQTEACSTCSGDGTLTPEGPTDEAIAEWAEEVRTAIQDALDNCPL